MGAGDLDNSTDPSGSKRATWIRDSLTLFTTREAELAAWRQALLEAIALGIVRCDDVVAYNRAAIENYEYACYFYQVIGDLVVALAQRGYTMMPGEVPYPVLIGTKLGITGSPNGRKFDYGLVCTSTGQFDPATPRSTLKLLTPSCGGGSSGEYQPLIARVPATAATPSAATGVTKGGALVYQSPYATFETLNGPAAVAAACGASILAAFVCIGLALTVAYLASTAVAALKTITGTDKSKIDAKLYERQLEQQRKRAEFWLSCMKSKIGASPNPQISEADKKAYGDDCMAVAIKTYPDVEPPYTGGGLGLIATGLLAIGVVAGIGILVRRRHASD